MGIVKPKTLDHDSYVTPGSKRRWSSDAAGDAPQQKHARVETVTVAEAGDTVGLDIEETNKKSVDLDTYYEAIKEYVKDQTYPDNSSRNFKRLIRDQAKNYSFKDDDLYHEVGVKGQLKKIIMKREDRIKLLAEAHLKTNNKQQMVAYLDHFHWKGKLIDCEAYALASPLIDKVDSKGNKDMKTTLETKRILAYDREDTYQEISNYLVYDVFSNDDATKRLDYLKRQMKNFRVENGDLVHMNGSKKQRILQSATERQLAVAEAHKRKGIHLDLTSTYYAMSDSVFWFGMKADAKVYVTYCCGTENKHLLDRYFLFREHHMKHPLNVETVGGVEEVTNKAGEPDDQTGDIQDAAETQTSVETQTVMVTVPEALDGTEVSIEPLEEQIKPDVADLDMEVVTETGDASSADYMETAEPTVEVNTTDELKTGGSGEKGKPTRIIVKLTQDGNTIIVNEDGTETMTSTILQQPAHNPLATTASGSDDVTMAAVKSILQDAGALGSNEYVVHTSTVSASTSDMSHLKEDSEETKENTANVDMDLTVDTEETQEEVKTADASTEAAEDSDDWMYESEEDDDGGVYDDNQKPQSALAAHMQADGTEKHIVRSRQHFKCSQCNKIFFGPIKFKMHMYKHTGQKPFPCNQCHKKYTNKKSLVIHQRTHTGELPYLCSLCGRRCPSKIALKSHLKCHDGEGGGFPAKCDVCDRVFSRKHLMERHKLHKHINHQTEFKCTECNKVFGHQRSLRRHFMSAHLNVKNHICNLCGKSFYRKEYLTGHLIQHGGTVAEGLSGRKKASQFKPRPSVFNHVPSGIKNKQEATDDIILDRDEDGSGVQRIILHQDENGQLRVVDMATEEQVKRMLEARGLTQSTAGETMVVHIEEPGGEQQVVHVEHTEEQVVEVPTEEEQAYVEYESIEEGSKPQEYVIAAAPASTGTTHYMFTSSTGDISIQGNQELVYGQPAVQYEVECVGDVGDDEALSAINLLAQASAQQYENVISQI